MCRITRVYASVTENLEQHGHLLTTLLNELDSMIYLCRPDERWTIEFVSEGCKALTGYRPDDLLHNRRIAFADLMHPADREQVLAEIHQALRGDQPFSVEYRMLHLDGTERWVWERGRGVLMEGGRHNLVRGFIQDITDRHNREKALEEAEQRYRNIFENATEGIFQSTRQGQYIRVNPALARIYGYDSPDDMVDQLKDIAGQLYVFPRRRDEFARLLAAEGRVTNFESQVYRRDGSIIWISENAREVRSMDGELLYYEGTVEDISERKCYEETIAYQATHDFLTDLPNRTRLLHQIDQAISHARAADLQIAVVFIDLDHFKNVNDNLGHSAGDRLIRIISERLKACVRDSDTVARLGGDEFVVLLTDTRGPRQISSFVQRVLERIEEPCALSTQEYLITCSIGISQYPLDGQDADTLLKNADIAMYRAKQKGRNRFQFFTPDFTRLMAEKLRLEQELRVALKENQFVLHYQPQFDVASMALTGVEALVRWNRPGFETRVLPGHFIHLAEEIGLIHSLGQWVINESCRQLRAWQDMGYQPVPVSMNLSVRQFQQPDLVAMLSDVIQSHGVDPSFISIEVTESCLVMEEEKFILTLGKLKDLGLSIAIDDFGTGYCNMNSLKKWPFDTLKIDRSFIAGVTSDERDRAIYRGMVAMARHLGHAVVAEGVETREQYEFLRSIECNRVQGFYFDRPMPALEFEERLARVCSRYSVSSSKC